jgi:hypothetical protein
VAQLSSRVQADQFSKLAEVIDDNWMVDFVRGGWRLYEYHQEYTTTTGGWLKRLKAARRWDPEAGAEEGRMATFKTKEEAVAYHVKWLSREALDRQKNQARGGPHA